MKEYPKTIEEAHKKTYGVTYNKHPFVEGRCACEVVDRSNPRWTTYHQCSQKSGKGPGGLYCGSHAKKAMSGSGDVETTAWYRINYTGVEMTEVQVIASTAKTVTLKDGRTERIGDDMYRTKDEALDEMIRRAEKTKTIAESAAVSALDKLIKLGSMKAIGKYPIRKGEW